MNRTDKNPDEMLDAIIGDVRADEPDARVIEEAGRRVWARLAAEAAAPHSEAITNCAGFQSLLPEYKANTLTPARRMLMQDHLHECVACRKALHADEAAASPKVVTMKPRAAWMPAKWAVAATLVIGVGIGSWYSWENFGPSPSGSRAQVLAASGAVYRLQGHMLVPASVGTELNDRDVLRTAGGGHASVRLIDGSTVEVGERAEFRVSATRRDTTVYLDRGQIIVQAAKRRTGHLYVASPDSRVAVTGTIFSVNRGAAGSRVSVVEGEVHVEHGSENDVLHAGDQVSTHPSMGRTAVADEISWSRNYDQYLALLKQFVAVKGKLAQVQLPGLRYGSRLIDSVPEGTNIYVSLPNLGRAIADLQRIVTDQARQSPELQQWMQSQMPEFEKVTARMTNLGDYIGDEVVFASQVCPGFCGVLIAEVTRPGLREYIDSEIAKQGADMGSMKIVYAGNKVIMGEQPQLIEAAQRGGSQFASSEFGQAVSGVYRQGAGLFAAVNIGQIFRDNNQATGVGLEKTKYLIAEQKQVNGKSEYSAVVKFDGPRSGIASWLAAPGAMGSLNFVSPDAQFATSFVVKQPAQMLQDVLALAPGGEKLKFTSDDFAENFGVSLEQLASYLGGEVTIAVDGPLLPVPSWKIVAEVRDAVGLQSSIARMLETANIKLRTNGQPDLVLKQETVNGRTYYSMAAPFGQVRMEVNYVFVDGYLLAAPNRNLLDRAMRDRAAGTTLARSQQFTNLLPRDNRANYSGMVYENAGQLMQLMADTVAVRNVTPEQQKEAAEIARSVEPMLVCVYGENDRIEVASQSDGMNLLLQAVAGRMLVPDAIKNGTQPGMHSYR